MEYGEKKIKGGVIVGMWEEPKAVKVEEVPTDNTEEKVDTPVKNKGGRPRKNLN